MKALSNTIHSLSRCSFPALPRASVSKIETLEDRVVLATVFVVPPWEPADATHVYSLAAGLALAGAGGTVFIEPGAVADLNSVTVSLDDVTIQGVLGVAPGSLPAYDLTISADRVVLNNLNLGAINLTATADHITISQSKFFSFTETGAVSGVGGNILRHNEVSGFIDLGGNSGMGELTGDLVEYNTIVSQSPVVVKLTNSNASIVQFNEIYNGISSAVGIQVRSNSDNVSIIGNRVQLTGAGQPFAAVLINTGGAAGNLLSAKVLNNDFNAGVNGTGLLINIFGTGTGMVAQLEGNEFAGNKVGLDINGIGGAAGAGNIDVGGGSNVFGTSKGANNFRGFTGVDGRFAIYLHNTEAVITVTAQKNIYTNGVTPGSVNRDKNNGGGSGVIDATNPLNANEAYVQSLFTQLLGRVADPATGGELELAVAKLAKQGKKAVAKSILFSTESLTRVVDGLFLDYLDRHATDAEKTKFAKLLKSGNLAGVEASILSTAEYATRANSDFVQAVYQDVLDRSATIAELTTKYRVARKGMALSVAQSAERRVDYVADLYRDFLHRDPTAEEVTAGSRKPGTLLKLQLNLLSSDDFFNNG